MLEWGEGGGREGRWVGGDTIYTIHSMCVCTFLANYMPICLETKNYR